MYKFIFRLLNIPFIAELLIGGSFIFTYLFHKSDYTGNLISKQSLVLVLEYSPMALIILYFTEIISKYLHHNSFEKLLREDVFTIIVFFSLIITFNDIEFSFWLASAHLLSSILNQTIEAESEIKRNHNISLFSSLSPAQASVLFFSFLVLLGALLLMLPISSEKHILSFADALFMSSSAVSTTGLASVSLPDDLTLFGRFVVLILVQIGALGLMIIFSVIIFFYGKQLNTRESLLLQDLMDSEHRDDLFAMLRNIIYYTFIIEAWGGLILTVAFLNEGFSLELSMYHGFFHSISAFCTAGFSTFANSLEDFATNDIINITVSILSILGALGFIVLHESKLFLLKKIKISQMSLHSKVVLVANFIFLFGGTCIIFFNEFLNSLDRYGLWDKMQISFFQFMTASTTAGFNTIPINGLQSSTLFFLLPVMFIGGAPGSTAGGIKITTIVILVHSLKASFFGGRNMHIHNRSIPNDVIIKCVAVTIISLILVSLFILLILFFEPNQNFLVLVFEVLSSFGTVGLSMGVTSYLTPIVKIALAILMLFARIGPLTLVFFLGSRLNVSSPSKEPEGSVFIV